LPPSGPPSGLNFSRWTEAQPWPPLPAATCSSTRSTKVVMVRCLQRRTGSAGRTGVAERTGVAGAISERRTRLPDREVRSASRSVRPGLRPGAQAQALGPGSRRRSGLRPPPSVSPRSGDRNDVHDLAAAVGSELHRTGLQREQRVVAAAADTG